MRLSDAGLRCRQTKVLYLNHRLPPWLTEAATLRSLEPIVRSGIHRSSFRNTSLRPDQMSLTAHTLMSTKQRGSATWRIVSSVMSVGTFAAFFGQDTQIDARTSSVSRNWLKCLLKVLRRETKTCAISTFRLGLDMNCTPAGIGATS
jgi:hypothetical protein